MLGSVEQEYLREILAALRDGNGAALIATADRMTERSLSFENALQDLGTLAASDGAGAGDSRRDCRGRSRARAP